VTQTPGTLKTKGWDRAAWVRRVLMAPVMREPKMGAYTELWAGLSQDAKWEDGGRCAISYPRQDILKSLKTKGRVAQASRRSFGLGVRSRQRSMLEL
jgi:hypothetical protein